MNFDLDGEETFGDKSYSVWDFPIRHASGLSSMPYRRGILRQTQNYDPFVDEALRYFDNDQRERIKGYTRAPGDEYDLAEKLRRYDQPPVYLKLSDSRFAAAYSEAVSEVMSEFKLHTPVVPRWILDVDLVKSTSSGFPRFIRKGDAYQDILQDGRFHLHHLKLYDLDRCPLLPCTVASRGGLSEVTDPKTRLVWMYPGAMTAAEAVFAQPLIDAIYDEKKDLLLTGVDSKFRIQKYLSLLDGDDDILGLGIDFKSFDTFRCVQLIYDAFAVLRQNIRFGYYYDRVTGVQKGRTGVDVRAERAFDNIVEYFVHTPILLPNGRVLKKHVGVPSGSHFTNLIDSIVNRILIKTFSKYALRPIRSLRTNGDDSAATISRTYSSGILDAASSFFENFFRMTVSPKSVLADAPATMHISGTSWNNSRPFRPPDEWMMLATYSDTYVATPFDSFQRLLGLGIAGAFRDATYCRFFDYFQRGFDCRTDSPSLMNWKRLRWLEFAFNITDLPIVFKQGSRTTQRLRLLVT